MKKSIALLLGICLALSIIGCSASPNAGDSTDDTTAPDIIITPSTDPYTDPVTDVSYPMHGIAMPLVKEATTAKDGTVLFTRTYQKIQLALGSTNNAGAIADDLQKRIGSALSAGTEIEGYAKDEYDGSGDWNPYFINLTYTPTRIDKSVISLFGNHSSYSGGSHPSLVTESVTYDVAAGKALTLTGILTPGSTAEDLSTLIADALAPSADKLSLNYRDTLQSLFSVNLNYITNWYFSRTGLCFHFAPYVIASYASGTIIAEIPYNQLNNVVKAQYLPEPPVKASGSMYAEMYLEDDAERFPNLTTIELVKDGTAILLYPDANVTDVRIVAGNWSADGNTYIPTATVFAADIIGLGGGIVIHTDFSETATVLQLHYTAEDQSASAFIVYDKEGDAIQLAHG